MLKAVGYETAMSGKWHMGSHPEWGPQHFGFDSSHGSLAGAVGMNDHRYRLNTDYTITWHRDGVIIPGYENPEHVTDITTREAVQFIERKHDKPFFLYLPYHTVHTPLVEEAQWFNDPLGKIAAITNPDRQLYAAAVHHFDWSVGEIMKALQAAGVDLHLAGECRDRQGVRLGRGELRPAAG